MATANERKAMRADISAKLDAVMRARGSELQAAVAAHKAAVEAYETMRAAEKAQQAADMADFHATHGGKSVLEVCFEAIRGAK